MNLIVCSVLLFNLNTGEIQEKAAYFRNCSRASIYFESAQEHVNNWQVIAINYTGKVNEE